MPRWLRAALGHLEVGEVLVAPALRAGIGVGLGRWPTTPVARRLVQVLDRDPFN